MTDALEVLRQAHSGIEPVQESEQPYAPGAPRNFSEEWWEMRRLEETGRRLRARQAQVAQNPGFYDDWTPSDLIEGEKRSPRGAGRRLSRARETSVENLC